ncbi:hypothetical protein [Brevibacillus brevis]|uniref:hypothetical protein n=1 Tax=Brevibacillus brevis TaxID=1393 RepID=UPI000D0FDB9F|nr:hypothetical protein [Brevibacillus brevis]PSJ63541.1 hypothetical protein C7J99_31275 [Brevibacillus brevis]RED33852.1 hypothetical protein DES34_10217 [Brevibacillus brevis]GEC93343.1 hypothetical protein BBR01nite_56740 [Brevibacillus brevis]VEF92578.1 Uncharacterised protein [Brevibacillus brevis]
MRYVNTIIDYTSLLKEDKTLELKNQKIISWLSDYLPYTEKILVEIKNNGIKSYPSIVDEFYKYRREYSVVDENKQYLIKERIVAVLKLLDGFYKNHHSAYIDNYNSILNIKSSAFRNMLYMSSKIQSLNQLDPDFIRKQDVIMFHLNVFKDTIEGVLNKLLSPIIFILEYDSIGTPIDNIESRYFSEKYFSKRDRNYKNIESDFRLLYEDTNTALRNAEAHFDYTIDERTETITYKNGNRRSPTLVQSTLKELKDEIKKLSEVARQIGIAYEIFWYEHAKEFPGIHPETNFDQNYIAIRQVLMTNRLILKSFRYERSTLKLYIEYVYPSIESNVLITLLRQCINFLYLSDSFEEPVSTIEIVVNESITIPINIQLIKDLEKNLTKETFELFISTVLNQLKKHS